MPFADCLNHSNVAVKYDFATVFDEAAEGGESRAFRMWPSGPSSARGGGAGRPSAANCYPKVCRRLSAGG